MDVEEAATLIELTDTADRSISKCGHCSLFYLTLPYAVFYNTVLFTDESKSH